VSAVAWERLGAPAPRSLVDARLQLHHAAQLVAAVGKSLIEPRPDDSHPSFAWDAAARVLAGHGVSGARPFRAALRPAELQLLLLDGEGKAADSLGLAGRTLEEGYAWLRRVIEVRFDRPLASGLTRAGYELPPHPVARGAPFALEPAEAFAELGRWYANADALLVDLARRTAAASEVRCWPHHFDLATLVTLEADPRGRATRTVGLGLSPGDDAYPEPYAYVTPWPYPEASRELPPLPSGRWHREGFTAAILTGSELVAGVAGAQQAERLRAFFEAGLAASRGLHAARAGSAADPA
jgi:hypothetical protein